MSDFFKSASFEDGLWLVAARYKQATAREKAAGELVPMGESFDDVGGRFLKDLQGSIKKDWHRKATSTKPKPTSGMTSGEDFGKTAFDFNQLGSQIGEGLGQGADAIRGVYNDNPELAWGTTAGAGLGLLSSAGQPKRRRRPMTRMLTGALLGGVGGAALKGFNEIGQGGADPARDPGKLEAARQAGEIGEQYLGRGGDPAQLEQALAQARKGGKPNPAGPLLPDDIPGAAVEGATKVFPRTAAVPGELDAGLGDYVPAAGGAIAGATSFNGNFGGIRRQMADMAGLGSRFGSGADITQAFRTHANDPAYGDMMGEINDRYAAGENAGGLIRGTKPTPPAATPAPAPAPKGEFWDAAAPDADAAPAPKGGPKPVNQGLLRKALAQRHGMPRRLGRAGAVAGLTTAGLEGLMGMMGGDRYNDHLLEEISQQNLSGNAYLGQ